MADASAVEAAAAAGEPSIDQSKPKTAEAAQAPVKQVRPAFRGDLTPRTNLPHYWLPEALHKKVFWWLAVAWLNESNGLSGVTVTKSSTKFI